MVDPALPYFLRDGSDSYDDVAARDARPKLLAFLGRDLAR
jgi:hypothetical protein